MGEASASPFCFPTDPELFPGSARLLDLGQRAAADPAVRAALAQPADQALQALRGTWFEAALREALDQHGDRPISGFTPPEPTWRELPGTVVDMVRTLMASSRDPAAEQAAF